MSLCVVCNYTSLYCSLYQREYAEDESDESGIKANSFQLRLYNPRLGRWLSPDPKHQYHSPYLGMGNNPVSRVDPDGGSDCEDYPDGWDPSLISETIDFDPTWLGSEKLTFVSLPGFGETPEMSFSQFDFNVFFKKIGDNLDGYKTVIDQSIIKIADGDFTLLADMAFFGYVQEGNSTSPTQSLEQNAADGVMFALPFFISRKIGRCHQYHKHVVIQREFPNISSKEQLVQRVVDVTSDVHSRHKTLSNGREAWYRRSDNALVLKDLNNPDSRTIFKPSRGEAYFNDLE